jgi:hypothetical protein
MPVFYTIDPTLNLLFYAALGICTGDQFIQAARQSTQDPLRHPNMNIVFDLVAMTELDFDVSTLRQGVTYLREWHGLGNSAEKTAIISKGNSAANSTLLSSFELMTSGFASNWKIFRDLPSALSWLDLTASTPQVLQIQAAFQQL